MKSFHSSLPARLIWLGALSCGAFGRAHAQPHVALPSGFGGRLLVTISDADMLASAYIDDQLGPAQGVDTLSVVRLDKNTALRAVTLPATNSVTGPPAALAVAPDGRYAIIVETLGPRAREMTKLSELPLGQTLLVVDLADPDRPKLVQRLACPAQPETISINAAGSLVAVTFGTRGAGQTTPLMIYRFAGGQLSNAVAPAIPGWTLGHELGDAEFSPQDDTLALLDKTAAQVSFVKVAAEGALTRWGNAVSVGAAPFLVRWTPNGRYVLVNPAEAGADFTLRGLVMSIRVAASRDAGGAPEHKVVARALTGVIPEGLAISPDGRWVATSNLERSWSPQGAANRTLFSSLTLLRLDPASGALERVGDFPFDGILPETVLFDNSSQFIASTTFDRFDGQTPGGSLDFWRIAPDAADAQRVELVKNNVSLPVTRGAHTMVIVR